MASDTTEATNVGTHQDRTFTTEITPTVEYTVPAVGILLSTEQRFLLPEALAPGDYRACLPLFSPGTDRESACASLEVS